MKVVAISRLRIARAFPKSCNMAAGHAHLRYSGNHSSGTQRNFKIGDAWAVKNELIFLTLLAALLIPAAGAQTSRSGDHKYPPIQEYLMPLASETALAKSAAPASISGRATIKALTISGFKVVHPGDNGFVCEVMRAFSAPTYSPAQFRDLVYDSSVRAPICLNPQAAREVLPYYELRTKLGMASEDPHGIAKGVQAAYAKGQLPERTGVSFAYMWSADQNLAPGVGAWHPHVMVFAPYYENSMLGGNQFATPLPQVTDDAGTPFAVVVIPVDDKLAIKTEAK